MSWSRRDLIVAGAAAGLYAAQTVRMRKHPSAAARYGRSSIGTARADHGVEPAAATLQVAGKIYQRPAALQLRIEADALSGKIWTISPDGHVYTFALQPNVKWHDGQPFSAPDDVVYSATEFLPETHARWRRCSTAAVRFKATDHQYG